MTTKIILDEEDVRDAIAKEYDVEKDAVEIRIRSRTVVNGVGEREENYVEVEIKK